MKKPVVIFIIILAALLLHGCSSNASFRTYKQIVSDKTLRVYVDPVGEPFAFERAGSVQGTEVEFMRQFAEHAGVEAVFTASSYDGMMTALNAGEADVGIGGIALYGGSYPSGYSLPISEDTVYIVSRRKGELFNSFPSLEGKKVGTLDSDNIAALALQHVPSGLELASVQSLEAGARYLSDGTLDAVLCLRRSTLRLLEGYGEELACEDIVGMEPLRYAAVVAGGNDTLLAAINNYITDSKSGDVSA